MRNPWSTKPFGPISVQLMYGNYLTQVCPNIYLTVTTPSSLATAMIINLTNLAISTTNSQVRLSFSLTNSIVFNTSMANRLQVLLKILFRFNILPLSLSVMQEHFQNIHKILHKLRLRI